MTDHAETGDRATIKPIAHETADPKFLARIGLAIARPRWALAVADDRRFGGRSGSDLIAMIMILLLATQLRGLVAAVWLGAAEDFAFGARAVMHVLTRTLTVDLAFLVVGALLLWIVAGPKRNLGRAFDLACVAAVPLLIVDLGATTVVRTFELPVPHVVSSGLAVMSWAWTGALLALASRPARIAAAKTPSPPRVVVVIGKRFGWGVLAVAIVGFVIQTAWIVRNTDLMAPVSTGEAAPQFALPTIDRGGTLGPSHPLAASVGKVTVVDFWATWCGPCLTALPKLEGLSRRPGVEVLAIHMGDPVGARALFDKHGYRMKLLADDGATSDRYNVATIPHTVVIDHHGIVRAVVRGAGTDIEALIDQIQK